MTLPNKLMAGATGKSGGAVVRQLRKKIGPVPADNYVPVSLGITSQLGLYASLVGDSQNVPASDDGMTRVATAVLMDPARHERRRYLIDHRQSAFALGDPTDAVHETTGKAAKSLDGTIRAYAALPEAQRNFPALPLWRGANSLNRMIARASGQYPTQAANS